MSLRLHKTKGVNPRLTCCRNCGKDVGVALLGASESVFKCSRCDMKSIGGRPRKNRPGHLGERQCPGCGAHDSYVRDGVVGEYDKIPDGLCTECEETEAACAEVVREGGIFWKCSKCGSAGAIRASAPLAAMVREQMDIAAPDPVGVDFEGDSNCPVCSKEESQDENDTNSVPSQVPRDPGDSV